MSDKSFLNIVVLENGEMSAVTAVSPLKTSQGLLSDSLNGSDISISECRTIILMKLIRPTSQAFTWLVKDPPEVAWCPTWRCMWRSAHQSNDDSLWIKSSASGNSPYLTLTIDRKGDIQSAKVRDKVLEASDSLIKEPLNLGDLSIGEFQTITLLKVVRSDHYYTWFVKHSFESSAENKNSAIVKYTGVSSLQDDSLWISP